MSYCNLGDKPKVYFKFGSGSEQNCILPISPIDVSMEDYSEKNTANYSPLGYQISFYSPNNSRGYNLIVRDWKIEDNNIFIRTCNASDLTIFATVDPTSLIINTAITCGGEIPDILKSRLHIKKAGVANDIFTATGDYPGSFHVTCGDCPEGFCKCIIPEYPGYCCLDCNAAAASIRSITNELKGKNNG